MFKAATRHNPETRKPEGVEVITNRSPFQLQVGKEIAERPAFEHFCGNWSLPEGSKYKGPVVITWFEDGCLHSIRVGWKRLLSDEYVVPRH